MDRANEYEIERRIRHRQKPFAIFDGDGAALVVTRGFTRGRRQPVISACSVRIEKPPGAVFEIAGEDRRAVCFRGPCQCVENVSLFVAGNGRDMHGNGAAAREAHVPRGFI